MGSDVPAGLVAADALNMRMRAVIQLGLVALILHAMVRVGPVYV